MARATFRLAAAAAALVGLLDGAVSVASAVSLRAQDRAQAEEPVKLDPFATPEEACDYCATSFTRAGQSPAGPTNPMCMCLARPADGGYNFLCGSLPAAVSSTGEAGGCRCNHKNKLNMGKTTCDPID
eukprot:TRINITY_DN35924_c0_g1_i1.p3 TRINITY_DN35924_c0_g1~~TRINITY_DN35924_c0_g1_i1.p3  ORF type:complete len:128 (-),score=26.26 TRINITY_DN35924_c0_g1_i1:62-445(-)